MRHRLKIGLLLVLAATLALGIVSRGTTPVQAFPVFMSASPSIVAVGGLVTVAAEWTDDAPANDAFVNALHSVPGGGDIVPSSCQLASMTANMDSQTVDLLNSPGTLDQCVVREDADGVVETSIIIIQYQCTAPGTIRFFLTQFSFFDPQQPIVTCVLTLPTSTPTPISSPTVTLTSTATPTATASLAATSTPTRTATPTVVATSAATSTPPSTSTPPATATSTPPPTPVFFAPQQVQPPRPQLGAFLNGASGTQENLGRAATAQAQAVQSAPQAATQSAVAITPPGTGDAGLWDQVQPGP